MSGGPIAPAESENVFYVIIDPTFLWHQRNLEFPPKGFSAISASGVGLMNWNLLWIYFGQCSLKMIFSVIFNQILFSDSSKNTDNPSEAPLLGNYISCKGF